MIFVIISLCLIAGHLIRVLVFKISDSLKIQSLLTIFELMEFFDVPEYIDDRMVKIFIKYWKVRVYFNLSNFGKYIKRNDSELFSVVNVIFRRII